MEFKCLFFNSYFNMVENKPEIKDISRDFKISVVELFDDNFLCFKLSKIHNSKKYGVFNFQQNREIPLNQELNNRDISVPDFIVIDQVKQNIYYTGSKSSAEQVVCRYLKIQKNSICTKVDIKKIQALSHIKIMEFAGSDKANLFTRNHDINVEKDIVELWSEPNVVSCAEHKYNIKPNNMIKGEKLSKLVKKYEMDKNIKFSLEGFDEDGNIIKYNDGICAIKYDILPNIDANNYEEINSLSLVLIKEELKKVIR